MTIPIANLKPDKITRIALREWDTVSPEHHPELRGLSFTTNNQARQIARQLSESDVLHITELRDGISIRSMSHVGRIQLGDLQITIRPKIKLNVLLTLFRYAYNLRDLRIISDADLNAEPDAFQDILIEQLVAEASELIARGLHRQYQRTDENLSVPKGRIDVQSLARRGGMIAANIPGIHHPRLEDCLINQALLSGLYFAVNLTGDLILQSRLRRVAKIIEKDVSTTKGS
jgi:5-methylcytosine-specific restriction endonuclease McrBC regulatory subunit McrC